MTVVGLTGSMASGKSKVAAQWARRGAAVFDADDCVHRLYAASGSEVMKQIAQVFPQACHKAIIDRDILRKLVFDRPENMKKLEEIVHPAVRAELCLWIRQQRAQARTAVAEVALLYEKDWQGLFDKVVVVCADRPRQLERIRNMLNCSREDARRRLSFFLSDDEKRTLADYVIENDGNEQDLLHKADTVWEQIKINA
ncbi:MAG: dephospho-CoA kinase [Candidatus Omnitrophica bacterium]|nr:dephospho-CoA kinase [Candidatus Omnitrophota bacterium]